MQQSLEIRSAIVFPSNRFLAADLPLAAAAAAAAATFLLFIIFLISGSLLTCRVSSPHLVYLDSLAMMHNDPDCCGNGAAAAAAAIGMTTTATTTTKKKKQRQRRPRARRNDRDRPTYIKLLINYPGSSSTCSCSLPPSLPSFSPCH